MALLKIHIRLSLDSRVSDSHGCLRVTNTLYQMEGMTFLLIMMLLYQLLTTLRMRLFEDENDDDTITRKPHFGGGADQETIPMLLF